MAGSLGKQRREARRAEAHLPSPHLATVYVTNAVRVSSGERTPGVVHVPPEEAGRLVGARHAVWGDRPPRGYADGGVDVRDGARMQPRRG